MTALRSILINVRQHANATRVVLHAEELEDTPGWAVTVHDDGVGFDTRETTYGVGIRTLDLDQPEPARNRDHDRQRPRSGHHRHPDAR